MGYNHKTMRLQLQDLSKMEFMVGEISITIGDLERLIALIPNQPIPNAWSGSTPIEITCLPASVQRGLGVVPVTEQEAEVIVKEGGMLSTLSVLKLKCWQFLHSQDAGSITMFDAMRRLANQLFMQLPDCEFSRLLRHYHRGRTFSDQITTSANSSAS